MYWFWIFGNIWLLNIVFGLGHCKSLAPVLKLDWLPSCFVATSPVTAFHPSSWPSPLPQFSSFVMTFPAPNRPLAHHFVIAFPALPHFVMAFPALPHFVIAFPALPQPAFSSSRPCLPRLILVPHFSHLLASPIPVIAAQSQYQHPSISPAFNIPI